MTERYTNMKVTISDNQKENIRKAAANDSEVTIQFTHEHLEGNDVLAFTSGQLNKIGEAFKNKKGIRIKMSKTQVKHNKTIEGGFIGSVLSAAAFALAPTAIKWLWDKITGKKEVYAKNGEGIVKIKLFGTGLYLRPYKSDAITGNGLYFKTGSGLEQLQDSSDLGILNELMKL